MALHCVKFDRLLSLFVFSILFLCQIEMPVRSIFCVARPFMCQNRQQIPRVADQLDQQWLILYDNMMMRWCDDVMMWCDQFLASSCAICLRFQRSSCFSRSPPGSCSWGSSYSSLRDLIPLLAHSYLIPKVLLRNGPVSIREASIKRRHAACTGKCTQVKPSRTHACLCCLKDFQASCCLGQPW